MYRYKPLFSDKLSLRVYNAQYGEIMANIKSMNKKSTLGMPVRQRAD